LANKIKQVVKKLVSVIKLNETDKNASLFSIYHFAMRAGFYLLSFLPD